MSYESLKDLLVMDAIRHTGNCVPLPLVGNWTPLKNVLTNLEQENFVSEQSDCYQIAEDGKRALLLFETDRKSILSRMEGYEEVSIDGKTIDARIPLLSLIASSMVDGSHLLAVGSLAVKWDGLLAEIISDQQDNNLWQERILTDSLYDEILKDVNFDAWKALGKTDEEARATADWLLSPPVKING